MRSGTLLISSVSLLALSVAACTGDSGDAADSAGDLGGKSDCANCGPLELARSQLIRDQHGAPVAMKFWNAAELCAKRGAHLPTFGETVEFATALGAAGLGTSTLWPVLDLKLIPTSDGFDPIMVHSGLFDSYDRTGFRTPTGELANATLWTSSTVGASTEGQFIYPIHIDMRGGSIVTQQEGVPERLARCVPDSE